MSIDEFKQLDLRVAKIIGAERVANSEKLLKLEVDLGKEQRTIVAGIAKNYSPKELINKEIVIVYNLEEKELLGIKSQGMLLAAASADGPVILMPEKEVLPGTKIH